MSEFHCTIQDCGQPGPNAGRGMCNLHYHRFRKHGDPLLDTRDPQRRFWAKVQKTSGCWLWQGATIRGHGAFRLGGRTVYAHRASYEFTVGTIDHGLTIDHLCKTPLCVNPDHLEPVSAAENTRRAVRIGYFNGPVTCRRGHDWEVTPPLLAHRRDGRVTRQCRVCADERIAS